jgi:hypothetical protein
MQIDDPPTPRKEMLNLNLQPPSPFISSSSTEAVPAAVMNASATDAPVAGSHVSAYAPVVHALQPPPQDAQRRLEDVALGQLRPWGSRIEDPLLSWDGEKVVVEDPRETDEGDIFSGVNLGLEEQIQSFYDSESAPPSDLDT